MRRGRPAKFNDKEKWCPECEAWVALDGFGRKRSTASGRETYCKPCKAKKNQPYKTTYRRRKAHGITDADFQEMWVKQRGLCAVCDRSLLEPGTVKTGKTCIDHDHATNVIRGLLCES